MLKSHNQCQSSSCFTPTSACLTGAHGLPFSALLLLGAPDSLLCISFEPISQEGGHRERSGPASWSTLPLLFFSKPTAEGPSPWGRRPHSHLSFLLRPQAVEAGMWHTGDSCPMYQALVSQNSLSAAQPYLYLLDTHKYLSNGLSPYRLSAH